MSLRPRLRAALITAMKARDRTSMSVLRSTLAAIDNAEAVESTGPAGASLAIERTPLGVGAAEVARLVLTEEQVTRIVRAEVAERAAAARDYDRAGEPERAGQLRAEADVLLVHLAADT